MPDKEVILIERESTESSSSSSNSNLSSISSSALSSTSTMDFRPEVLAANMVAPHSSSDSDDSIYRHPQQVGHHSHSGMDSADLFDALMSDFEEDEQSEEWWMDNQEEDNQQSEEDNQQSEEDDQQSEEDNEQSEGDQGRNVIFDRY